MASPVCPFCRLIQTGVDSINGQRFERSFVYETNSFVVFPSAGSFVQGYVLIVPKQCILSMKLLPSALFKELEEVCQRTKQVLSSKYGPVIFFEHGPASVFERGGCCVDHAHIHAVPLNKQSIRNELSGQFSETQIKKLAELQHFQLPKGYLFFEESDGKRFAYAINDSVPSQYLRQLAAHAAGVSPKWDWRKFPEVKTMDKTYKQLKPLFRV